MKEENCEYFTEDRTKNCSLRNNGILGRIRCPYELRDESLEKCTCYSPLELKKNHCRWTWDKKANYKKILKEI